MSEKLVRIFSESLGIPRECVDDELKYAEEVTWDSVAHMALIAAIEEAFDIMIDAEDVINMSSFAKAKQIVSKYLE